MNIFLSKFYNSIIRLEYNKIVFLQKLVLIIKLDKQIYVIYSINTFFCTEAPLDAVPTLDIIFMKFIEEIVCY